ncbi:MAG: tail fiber protein, partial [Marinifilaceae bacterium]
TSTNVFNYYNGTSWEPVGGNDNLGNHTATENVQLNGKYLSNDGDTEGINIGNSGTVLMSKDLIVEDALYVGGASSVDFSAALGIGSTTKGFLPPRMTTIQRDAINSPAIGLVVFDTNYNQLYIFTGTWTEVGRGDKIPVGTINAFAGSIVPSDWMLCDGSTFSAAIYPDLQTVLGGITLPDLRGVFLRGLDSGRGLDTGRTLRSFQDDALKAHNHSGTTSINGDHTHSTGSSDFHGSIDGTTSQSGSRARQSGYTTGTAGDHSHSLNINNTGGSETRPKNVSVNYIIKAK